MTQKSQLALTRDLSPGFANCELTYLPKQPIQLDLAVRQHQDYRRALSEMGLPVKCLPSLHDNPDCVFIEDTAVVLEELAIITRMGALSRRSEPETVVESLAEYRELKYLTAPASLDGGDVLCIGKNLYVGLSTRTNEESARQLEQLVRPFGYRLRTVRLTGCLHLKTACTYVGNNTLLINRNWIDPSAFAGYDLIDIHPSEPFAANALLLNGNLLCSAQNPLTNSLMANRKLQHRTVDISELAKAEGGLTCLRLLVL